MTTDRYTRIVLTVIAASLAVDAGSRLFAIPVAYAAATRMDCKITDTVKVEGTIKVDGSFGGTAITIKATDAIPIKATDAIPTKVMKH